MIQVNLKKANLKNDRVLSFAVNQDSRKQEDIDLRRNKEISKTSWNQARYNVWTLQNLQRYHQ